MLDKSVVEFQERQLKQKEFMDEIISDTEERYNRHKLIFSLMAGFSIGFFGASIIAFMLVIASLP